MKKVYNFFRFLLESIDPPLMILVLILSVLGILFSYSAQLQIYEIKINPYNKYLKQIVYLITGVVLIFLISRMNYRKICEHFWILYLGCLIILVYTLVWGSVVNNSKRWISFGFVQGQPSEFVKIVMVLFIAKFLDQKKERINEIKNFVLLLFLVGVPIAMILMQPDLGTALVFIPTILFMLWVGGVKHQFLVPILLIGAITTVFTITNIYIKMNEVKTAFFLILISREYYFSLVVFFISLASIVLMINFRMNNLFLNYLAFYSFVIFLGLVAAFLVENVILKEYQKERLVVFLNPYKFRWSLAYNIVQSQISIGSGGLWGKGIFNGTQSQLGFLPSSATDFIFAVIGEELGFVGTAIILFVFLLFLLRLWQISKQVKDYLGGYVVTGLFVLFTFQIFINIGMTISLLPITGIPLPFISAGGSTLVSSLFAIGVIFSVYSRRYVYLGGG